MLSGDGHLLPLACAAALRCAGDALVQSCAMASLRNVLALQLGERGKPARQLRTACRKGQQGWKQAACLKKRMYTGSCQKQWLLRGLCCTG